MIAHEPRLSTLRNSAKQLVERVHKLLDPLLDQLFRDLIQRDAVLLESGEDRAGAPQVLRNCVGRCLTMISESVRTSPAAQ